MEIVQKRMEIMSAEVEQMRRIKLFSPDECKKILKMRKQHEYKISGISKNLDDFQEYIDYLTRLLKTIRYRRGALKIGEKVGHIEHKVMYRIKELYETAVQRFPRDTTVSLAYFKFCKQAKYTNAASVAVSNMIKNHSDNIEIWQVAAKWHAFDQKDVSTALKVLCKGLAKHNTSKVLYKEVIQLEIHTAMVNSNIKTNTNELSSKQKLCVDKLLIYIKEIITHIDDCEYFVELLDLLEEHKFTMPVQNIIIEHLVKNHSSKAITWDMLAQRDNKGLANSLDNEVGGISTKMKLTKCINRYRQGLDCVSLSEKGELWSYYLNCMIDARQEDRGVAAVFKTNSLKEAFAQGSAEGYLLEKHYIQWADLVDHHEKANIMEQGIIRFPQSIELWKFYLKIEILASNPPGIERVFKNGVEALKEKSLPLWTGVIRYHLLVSDDDTIEKIYREGVKQPQEVSDVLKPHYIEWLALAKSMNYTREQYFALAKEKPYCKELHVTMSKLESTEIEYDYNIWDQIHQLACDQFGKEDVEVWLNRIQYYLDYKKGRITKEAFQQTYMEARNSLPDVLFLDFRDKYNSMVNENNA